jgi:hypothetical protein
MKRHEVRKVKEENSDEKIVSFVPSESCHVIMMMAQTAFYYGRTAAERKIKERERHTHSSQQRDQINESIYKTQVVEFKGFVCVERIDFLARKCNKMKWCVCVRETTQVHLGK